MSYEYTSCELSRIFWFWYIGVQSEHHQRLALFLHLLNFSEHRVPSQTLQCPGQSLPFTHLRAGCTPGVPGLWHWVRLGSRNLGAGQQQGLLGGTAAPRGVPSGPVPSTAGGTWQACRGHEGWRQAKEASAEAPAHGCCLGPGAGQEPPGCLCSERLLGTHGSHSSALGSLLLPATALPSPGCCFYASTYKGQRVRVLSLR